ncbi:ribosomal protein L1 [Spizellomyces punctatus DAOM BR117]|uniref:Ribosomal protein L1 n=1 Tax=Spizellomyces punctatus (strain DAOM BR117) TaxID=645134 RepID=A0A0L0HMP2_SPIPD|nr:ribosomal protein L1 [Spizellomyces punctatus DAOM BR117]KND02696.1 ribosomal protein L1 [Spizellomyces punctatus DAOM BR117]|eukprot:XP_016610735.1 ribosomal protein L1 [Spizellomyces punctatus DAOM BR117]
MSIPQSCGRLLRNVERTFLTFPSASTAHSAVCASRASRILPFPPGPTLVSTVRHYDRKRYLREKKRLKAQQNQEDVSFEEAFSVFRTYCLGEDRVVSAHIQVHRQEGTRTVRGEVNLPTQVSADDKSVILVFAKGEQAEEAKKLGAHIVGAEELIEEILADKVAFDKVLSTKAMFPEVVKIARVLGPKGLMPSPAKGTVSDDIPKMMSALRASSKFEVDADGFVHLEIGKTAWRDEDVFENIRALLTAILSVRPPKTDANKFIESVNISAKYTPGLKLPLKPFKAMKPVSA